MLIPMWRKVSGRHPRRQPAPRLEALEDRCLPSTVTVTTTADHGTGSLRAALANPNADTVLIAASLAGRTVTLTSGELLAGHNITVRNQGGERLTVSGNNASRVFEVAEGVTASLDGLTVTGGLVTSNSFARGGGILNSGTLSLTDCGVLGNRVTVSAPGHGGEPVLALGAGIASFGGSLSLVGCTVSGNTASVTSGVDYSNANGGGIFGVGGVVALCDSTVSGNATTAAGAGLCSAYGGGVTVDGGTLTLIGCTIAGDNARGGRGDGAGGGLHLWASTLDMTNCTLANNWATGVTGGGGVGGAIHALNSQLTLIAATVANNNAGGAGVAGTGGGIDLDGGSARLMNTLVATNLAETSSPDLAGTFVSWGTNLIGNRDGSNGWGDSDLTGTAANPLNARLAPLAANGGPTLTVAEMFGSPALDAGSRAGAPAIDQRGVVRRGGANIGAYQATADHFVLSAPAIVTAGMPFAIAVAAVDPFGQPALGYTGTVYLASTDPQVANLDQYTYNLADASRHTFVGEALYTAGPQTLFGADGQISSGLTLTVLPSVAVQLVLGGPDTVQAGVAFTVKVTAYDAYGNVATGYRGTVHFDSTDSAALLPDNYAFQPTDQGSASVTVTLNTPGPVHLTVTDTSDGSLNRFLDLTVT